MDFVVRFSPFDQTSVGKINLDGVIKTMIYLALFLIKSTLSSLIYHYEQVDAVTKERGMPLKVHAHGWVLQYLRNAFCPRYSLMDFIHYFPSILNTPTIASAYIRHKLDDIIQGQYLFIIEI